MMYSRTYLISPFVNVRKWRVFLFALSDASYLKFSETIAEVSNVYITTKRSDTTRRGRTKGTEKHHKNKKRKGELKKYRWVTSAHSCAFPSLLFILTFLTIMTPSLWCVIVIGHMKVRFRSVLFWIWNEKINNFLIRRTNENVTYVHTCVRTEWRKTA